MIKSLSTTLSTVDTVHGPGLLHPFPNQDDLWSSGALPIDLSPLSTDQGSIIEMTIDFMETSLIFIVIS